jgi:hypothetical protein
MWLNESMVVIEHHKFLSIELPIKPYSAAADASPGYRRFFAARSAQSIEQRYAPRPGPRLPSRGSRIQPPGPRTNRVIAACASTLRHPTQVRCGARAPLFSEPLATELFQFANQLLIDRGRDFRNVLAGFRVGDLSNRFLAALTFGAFG